MLGWFDEPTIRSCCTSWTDRRIGLVTLGYAAEAQSGRNSAMHKLDAQPQQLLVEPCRKPRPPAFRLVLADHAGVRLIVGAGAIPGEIGQAHGAITIDSPQPGAGSPLTRKKGLPGNR